MTRKQRRLTLLMSAMMVLVVAVGLVAVALQDTIVFFYSPSELGEKQLSSTQSIRIGGLVEEGSVTRGEKGLVTFTVTDLVDSVLVEYVGLLPDLFREGQGIVAQGRLLDNGVFVADQVLAKHDENYMPSEVADALRESGQWHGEDEAQ